MHDALHGACTPWCLRFCNARLSGSPWPHAVLLVPLRLQCWGRNIKAAIGIGSEDYELVAEPTAVMPSRSFRQLVAGDQHLCGIDAATGETVCWGCVLARPARFVKRVGSSH